MSSFPEMYMYNDSGTLVPYSLRFSVSLEEKRNCQLTSNLFVNLQVILFMASELIRAKDLCHILENPRYNLGELV